MNLFALLNKGAAMAPPPAHSGAVQRQVRKLRKAWKNALLVDQTRAWMDLGERQVEVLRGFSVTLSLAGLALAYSDRSEASPQSRIMRGAMSCIEQCCLQADAVVTASDAKALSSAATAAMDAIDAASIDAIIFAAERIARAGAALPK